MMDPGSGSILATSDLDLWPLRRHQAIKYADWRVFIHVSTSIKIVTVAQEMPE